MSVVKLFGKFKSNTQVFDLLDKIKNDFANGKHGNATKCIVIIENGDGDKSNIHYETCGLHLNEAIGILEMSKHFMMKGN